MLFSQQFGAKPSKADLHRFESSENFNGNVFVNQLPTKASTPSEDSSMLASVWDYLKGNPMRTPKPGVVEALTVTPAELRNAQQQTRILWFGHSSFLLQTGDKNYLFDPVFAAVPAPHPILGTKRYSGNLPIEPEDLPPIDAVFISHDHYDHLDLTAIEKLRDKTRQFFVPLGVGGHLKRWGVNAERIIEMDWWQETQFNELDIAFAPARHFSGRALTGQNQTLWGSWLVRTPESSIYFSGDTGYGPHFKEINERFGAIDFALLECGQYNPNWATIHMMPEETAQAAQDLQAKVMMPVHWGAFTLSLHDWNDPAIRVTEAADKLNQAIVIPQIGELLVVNEEPKPRNAWWEVLASQLFSKGA